MREARRRKGLVAWRPLRTGACVGFAIALAGCSGTPIYGTTSATGWPTWELARSPEESELAEFSAFEALPSRHEWAYTNELWNDAPGYSTYTYVLTARSDGDERSARRYRDLICAIQWATPQIDTDQKHAAAEVNLFVIPVARHGDAFKPGHEIAQRLLGAIAHRVPGSWNGAGPYLVTVLGTLEDRLGAPYEVDTLFIDLTNMHEGTFTEVVNAYQQRIQNKQISGVEQLYLIRLSLLDTLLDLENAVFLLGAAKMQLEHIGVLAPTEKISTKHIEEKELPRLEERDGEPCSLSRVEESQIPASAKRPISSARVEPRERDRAARTLAETSPRRNAVRNEPHRSRAGSQIR